MKKGAEYYEKRGDFENAVKIYRKGSYSDKRLAANLLAYKLKEPRKAAILAESIYEGNSTQPLSEAAEYYDMAGNEKEAERVREKIKRVRKGNKSSLEKHFGLSAGIVGLIGAIFFLSNNLTGNAIGNLSNNSSNYIGIFSLVIGGVGFYLWKRKQIIT